MISWIARHGLLAPIAHHTPEKFIQEDRLPHLVQHNGEVSILV